MIMNKTFINDFNTLTAQTILEISGEIFSQNRRYADLQTPAFQNVIIPAIKCPVTAWTNFNHCK